MGITWTNLTPQKHILLLSAIEDKINIERGCLRQLGLNRVRRIDSGVQALDMLNPASASALPIDFIICTEDINDMSVAEFVTHLAGRQLPAVRVIFIVQAEHKAKYANFKNSIFLERPYTLGTMQSALEALRQCAEGFSLKAQTTTVTLEKSATVKSAQTATSQEISLIQAETDRPKALENPLLLSNKATQLIRQGHYAEAEIKLRKAIAYDSLDLEACLSLARLKKQLDDEPGAQRWTHKAANICLRTGQTERASILLAVLPRTMLAEEPMLQEAKNMLLEEDYAAAAEAFVEAYTRQKDEPLHQIIARVCQFSTSPNEAIANICMAMDKNGYESTASYIAHRLLEQFKTSVSPDSLFSNFPRLEEIIAVARYTYKAWRSAA